MSFVDELFVKAKRLNRSIIFPEGDDFRVLKAASWLARRGVVKPVILFDKGVVSSLARKHRISLRGVEVLDPSVLDVSSLLKGVVFPRRSSRALVRSLLDDNVFLASLLVKKGFFDGLVTGATHPTAKTIKAGLKVIGLRKGVSYASSFFFLERRGLLLLFADAGFNIDPDSKGLASIALETARSARFFGIVPRVALLSFSTKGSASHPLVDKVVGALRIIRRRDPSLLVDGELQFDAAFVPSVRRLKAPDSSLGDEPANVFIFPDLNSGNIGYKIAQRLGGFSAYGPVLQGFSRPINDLSRGCDWKDVAVVAAITALQSVDSP